MEQIIEEYGIGGILFVIGTGVLAGLGKVLQLIAGVENMAAVVKEYGSAVLAAVGGVVFLGTLGQFLLSRQGLIRQMIEVWGNGGC